MSSVTRMNVSIPREVRDMIKACEEEVNWSAVATEAFRNKLVEVGTRKKEPTIDDAVLRLRTTASNKAKAGYCRGREAGRLWALSEAKARGADARGRVLQPDDRGEASRLAL